MFERRKLGAVDFVSGTDPLNLKNCKQFGQVLEECCRQGQPRIVVDLEHVPLIDSAGLETLLDFRDQMQERGGALKVAGPSALCREILSVTGLADQIEIFRDAQSAVASFAQ
ncbi:MAG: STAS domain-containing protein [Planctomycetia bacterium]|nr:STAS domain-containing protein [Planctomycetia bacterium]